MSAVRKQIVETLADLVERYPNLQVGQIIANALGGGFAGFDLYYCPDQELARALNQLLVTYTQFQAAGIRL